MTRLFTAFAIGLSLLSASAADAIVTREGEVILVNQPGLVTTFGTPPNQLIFANENQRQQLAGLIAEEIGETYDAFLVFPTFRDDGFPDPLMNPLSSQVTYTRLQQDVDGIGLESGEDVDFREDWNLSNRARVSGFIYANTPELLAGGGSLDDLNEPGGEFHQLVARRLAQRWLFSPLLPGADPLGLVGDDGWSNTADSGGSLFGGLDLQDQGDGTFRVINSPPRFAPLDLYLMGFIGADEVPPFFRVTAATMDGLAVGANTPLMPGDVISGERSRVAIEDILEGTGQRDPPATAALPYQRVAFVLLTRPGESRANFEDDLAFLNDLAADFPASWQDWSGVTICTKTTERCPEPLLAVDELVITDGNDDLVAPGESVDLNFEIRNVGSGLASGAQIEVSALSSGISLTNGVQDLPDVQQGESVQLTMPVGFNVEIEECDRSVDIRVSLVLQEGPRLGEIISIPIGTEQVRFDALDEAPNWIVDPDGADTAIRGTWELGIPESVVSPGVGLTQPDRDATLGDESTLAFMTNPRAGSSFASGDLDDGVTTLQSPVFAIGDTRKPRLRFSYWRNAFDFAAVGGAQPNDTPLIVEASNDGGDTFVEVATATITTVEDWRRLEVDLIDAGVEPTNRMVFRFTIEDPGNINVEAGIDDLEIIDLLPGCPGVPDDPNPGNGSGNGGGNGMGGGDDDDSGGGCAATPGTVLLWLLGVGAVLTRRRRTR